THVGYPLAIRVLARRGSGRDGDETALPTLTVVIPAFNEERFIADKIRDTLAQDYPRALLSIVVADDGSTDGTARIAAGLGVCVLSSAERGGKFDAINRAVPQADGDIVCLTDANGALAPGTLRAIAEAFDHPSVAVVSGTKAVLGTGAYGTGESFYWRMENATKQAESARGCTMGADGAIYAVRRTEFVPLPARTIADDLEVPFGAMGRGRWVRHAGRAVAYEEVSRSVGSEFERRTRIAAGVWQAIVRHRRLADPRRGWVAVAFVSHRVLRTAVVPPLLPVCLFGSAALARRSRVARGLLLAQLACYGAASAGALSDAPLLGVPLQFVLTNAASVRGAVRLLLRNQSSLWQRTERGRWVTAGGDA
ncbi:MAG TPA: glycosyltransferase family 2 protein, partial [Acidimicrobiia bacterium]|nr:glycosyltransferase family 2 protein [Acidimicrobiia bacterium]